MAGEGPNRTLIESIGNDSSQNLGILHREFHNSLEVKSESEIFCFFETLLSPTAIQVDYSFE
jgi:hypothetical protein